MSSCIINIHIIFPKRHSYTSIFSHTCTFFQQVEIPSVHQVEKFHVKGQGKQELVPGSGVYISSVRLHSIHSQCGTNPQKLFLLLIEAFFSEETLATSLAHGSRAQTGTGSLGKTLNQDVVNTIKGKCHPAS